MMKIRKGSAVECVLEALGRVYCVNLTRVEVAYSCLYFVALMMLLFLWDFPTSKIRCYSIDI